MPELADTLYCSEQICIPPTFPYLLRQFAKAAIRTQPTDLLKWSTAYFRCLSINIPPPVKPRLEYPIPRDYCGITPGWLKALIYQLQNNITISFKILWDRWIGACLEHDTLIQILCLGGFTDPFAIPWMRFIGLCAAHLTDNLTQTMILICEILTEEPEGGSAMIPLETFTDLYQFLADIDASQTQVLKNIYFTDSLLNLWKERVEKQEKIESKSESMVEEQSVTQIIEEKVEEQKEVIETKSEIISCPSLKSEEVDVPDGIILFIPEESDMSLAEQSSSKELLDDVSAEEAGDEISEEEEEEQEKTEEEKINEQRSKSKDEEAKEDGQVVEETQDVKVPSEEKESATTEEKDKAQEATTTEKVDDQMPEEKEEDNADTEIVEPPNGETDVQEVKETQEEKVEEEELPLEAYESVDTIIEEPRKMFNDDDDIILKEDLERLKALQQELPGETDDELEKFKCRLIEEMPITQSQHWAIEHFAKDDSKVSSTDKDKTETVESDALEEEKEIEYENVYVDVIPGIGPRVSVKIVETVCYFMKEESKIQHGMVMPRNIRHYNCPPLEKFIN